MLINWRKNYLFVHVPKTGGTSITQLLKHDCNRAFLPLRLVGYALDTRLHTLPEPLFPLFGYPYHVAARDLRRQWGAPRYDALFSFAFVRNPWDMVISEYFYIQKKWDHPLKAKVRRLGSFSRYLHWKLETGYHRNQSAWLTDAEGRIIVERIGRFKSYERDATEILQRIGRTETLLHRNATAKAPFREYYDDTLIGLVAEMYAEDIDRFGYSF